jgi:nitrite reductase (NADH) small subunit
MSEPRWIKVAPVKELSPGKRKQIKILARAIAVFNIDGQLRAFDGLCRHMKAPLVQGTLKNNILTCYWHGWQFDIDSGECLTEKWAALRFLDIKIEDDWVMVNISPLYTNFESDAISGIEAS